MLAPEAYTMGLSSEVIICFHLNHHRPWLKGWKVRFNVWSTLGQKIIVLYVHNVAQLHLLLGPRRHLLPGLNFSLVNIIPHPRPLPSPRSHHLLQDDIWPQQMTTGPKRQMRSPGQGCNHRPPILKYTETLVNRLLLNMHGPNQGFDEGTWWTGSVGASMQTGPQTKAGP